MNSSAIAFVGVLLSFASPPARYISATLELPGLTPHSLRRTFCSLLFALGEPHSVVMREMGHTDAKLTLNVYAQVMDRDEKENERLRALVNGESWGRLGTSAQSGDPRGEAVAVPENDEARS